MVVSNGENIIANGIFIADPPTLLRVVRNMDLPFILTNHNRRSCTVSSSKGEGILLCSLMQC